MATTGASDKTTEFSEDQIANWHAFERVRSGGRYNMFDPRARASTGLSGKEYSFVMENFSVLKKAAGK